MAKIVTARLVLGAFVASVVLIALAARPAHACDATFTFKLCNPERTSTGTSLYKAIQAVISDLAAETPFHSYDYKKSQVSGGVTAWEHASCRYGLFDCSACLQQVGKLILSSCGNAVGARYQVSDCFMEYENTSF